MFIQIINIILFCIVEIPLKSILLRCLQNSCKNDFKEFKILFKNPFSKHFSKELFLNKVYKLCAKIVILKL